jgi:hypothetical protein
MVRAADIGRKWNGGFRANIGPKRTFVHES